MIKNKIDYKLINIAIFVFIGFLLYQTKSLWFGIIDTIWKIVMPFILAFALAYAFYPLQKFFVKKKIPKGISVALIILLLLGIFALAIGLVIPVIFGQLSSLFNNIISFVNSIGKDYDINLGPLQESLTKVFNDIIESVSKYAKDGAISVINASLGALSLAFISFSSAIYFLIDMDKIRAVVKKYTLRKSKRLFNYIKTLDGEMNKYLTGFLLITLISFLEYLIVFTIIGHPNALLLGFLVAVASLIPYFGGMIVNVIASITAFVISPSLFIKSVLAFFILGILDSYLIGPKVYGKTTNVHPLIVIISVFAGGILFGIMGVIISLPVAITLITTYKFYEQDIYDVLKK